jgi:hypothetical protein
MIISLCIFRFNLFEFRIVWISFFFMDTAQVLPCKVIFYIGINSLKKGLLGCFRSLYLFVCLQ